MKIKCRRCDICGTEMGGRDFQYWIKFPKVRFGYPDIGMNRVDVCSECFAALSVEIKQAKEKGEQA